MLLHLWTIHGIWINHINFGEVGLIFVKTFEPIFFISFVIIFELWILALLVVLELILLTGHRNILDQTFLASIIVYHGMWLLWNLVLQNVSSAHFILDLLHIWLTHHWCAIYFRQLQCWFALIPNQARLIRSFLASKVRLVSLF